MAPNLPAEDRRRQFAAAARRAITRKGSFNVSVRDVAQEAGVSPGAILYHYEDFDAVLLAAWEQAVDRFARERQYILEHCEDAGERLATAIHQSIPSSADDDAYLMYAAIGHYRSNAALRALARGFTHGEIGLYQTILEAGAAGGAFEPAERSLSIARTLASMSHGLGIWIVHDDPQVDAAEGERLMRAYAERSVGAALPEPRVLPPS